MNALIARFRSIDRAVRLDATTWGIPQAAVWPLLVLPILAAIGVALAAPFPRLFHFLIDEDHVIEWAQFAAILLGSVAFAVAGWRAYRRNLRVLAILFGLVAVACFVVAGEEISWGQRILGLVTPDALKDINHQGETNIHNISSVQRLFNLGEMLVGLYGFGVPILVAVIAGLGRTLRLDRLLVPPLSLATLFVLPFGYRAIRAVFVPEAGERITQFGELPELTLDLGILICGVLIARALNGSDRARMEPG